MNLSLPLFDLLDPLSLPPGGGRAPSVPGVHAPGVQDADTPDRQDVDTPDVSGLCPLHDTGAVPAIGVADPADGGMAPQAAEEGEEGEAVDPLSWPSEQLRDKPDPARLHPGIWRAHQVGAGAARTTRTGFAALDAQLPGGGWPHAVLTELLLGQPGIGELRLLAPALRALAPPDAAAADTQGAHRAVGSRASSSSLSSKRSEQSGGGRGAAQAGDRPMADGGARCVMLFDPPARLSAWALAQQGLHAGHWLVVQPRMPHRHPRSARGVAPLLPAADLLWALEQALRSGHVGAVLAWLPLQLRADALRRLQLAAQTHDGPVFVFRDAQAASRPSPAPLRLLLQPAGVDGLALRLLKRRGPPLAQTLTLQLPPVLTPRQQAQAVTRRLLADAQRAAVHDAP